MDGDASSIDALFANKGADGFISLREAIWAANNTTNIDASTADVINFAIGVGGSAQTIMVNAGGLPTITDAIVLDASTQGANQLITLDGTNAVNSTGGLVLRTNDSIIRGFNVINFPDEGIEIDGTTGFGDDNLIEDNWVGITAGGAAAGNGDDGILVTEDADNNEIRNNVVGSSGGDGIHVRNNSDGNWLWGNTIGLADDGSTQRGNTGYGVHVSGTATNNIIGTNADSTDDTLEGNVISDNTGAGILVYQSDNNTIAGNLIGTDDTGTLDRGNNSYGISIDSSASTQIGGSSAAERNVIAANHSDGITLWNAATTLTVIQGNYIGVDSTGNAALGNTGDGIVIGGNANNNTIGGDRTAGEGNVISGNTGTLTDGIEIDNAGADNNKIYGNYIGTNYDGTFAIANERYGVVIYNGVQGTEVGGTGTGQGNIISGNSDAGVMIDGNGVASTSGNIIQANYIGTDVTGMVDLGNASDGIVIKNGAQGNTIGGTTAAHRNLISGNDNDGIWITGSGTDSNIVQGNWIGLDSAGGALGNSYHGIGIENGAADNLVGGTVAGAGNTIAHNAWDGVAVVGSGTGNSILGNEIYANTWNAIDLGNNGVTTNDGNDTDPGPNNLQNFPVITQADLSGGNLTLSGSLDTDGASTDYRIEFFGIANADGEGWGEGRYYLGTTTVTTNGSGDAAFSGVTLAGVTLAEGDYVTATATRIEDAGQVGVDDQLAYGSTSEFSANQTISSVLLNTLADNFDDGSGGASGATGNDGTQDWSTDWYETNDTDNNINFVDKNGGGDWRIQIRGDSSYQNYWISRQADLANSTHATLTYDYELVSHFNADFKVQVRDADTGWTTLADYSPSGSRSGSESFAIAANLRDSGLTEVRFFNGAYTDPDLFYVDNIQIEHDGDAALYEGLYLNSSGEPLAGMNLTAPTDPTLNNHDPGRDSAPGIILGKGGSGLNESDSTKFQTWVTDAGATTLSGPAQLSLWSAMKGFNTTGGGTITAYLVDSDASGGSLVQIASDTVSRGDWDSANSGTWIEDTFDFGDVRLFTWRAGRYLGVKIVVGDGSGDDMLIAYDATTTPSVLKYASNAPPMDIAPDSFNLQEHTDTSGGVSLGTLTTIDPDSGESFTYSILTGGDGNVFSIGGAGSDELILDDGVVDFETKSSYSVNVRVTDSGSNTYDETLIVNVIDLNDAPLLDNGGTMTLTAIAEDQINNSGQSVASIIASAGGDRITDPDSSAVEGIAITSLTQQYGNFEYSTNGGSTWNQVGFVSETSALSLQSTDLIRFNPVGDDGGTSDFTFSAWDQTSGTQGTKVDTSTNGGSTAFSAAVESASIVVTAVDDAPTFQAGPGYLTTVFPGTTASNFDDVQVMADGRTVAVGYVDTAGGRETVVARYLADGSLDTSFNGVGYVITPIVAGTDEARGVHVFSDGKILVVGSALDGSFDIYLAKYNSDGTLDTSFGGGDGIEIWGPIGVNPKSMTVLDDGKILVAGDSNSNFLLARFNANGSIDSSFGSGGYVTTDFAGGTDTAEDLKVQADGKIVLVGRTFNGTSYDVGVVRYLADGTLDASFGSGGKVSTDVGTGSGDYGTAIDLQSDGKLVVAGWGNAAGTTDFYVLRYDTNGTLDASFGTGGVSTTAIGTSGSLSDFALDVAVRSDGKIYATGYSSDQGNNFSVIRLNSNGSLDATFGSGGIVDVNFGGSSMDRASAWRSTVRRW